MLTVDETKSTVNREFQRSRTSGPNALRGGGLTTYAVTAYALLDGWEIVTHITMQTGGIEAQLEVIDVLARSANRVRVLEVLASRSEPVERRDVAAAADLSRATLSRTLATFEQRGWVDHTGSEYELTELGAFVAGEFLQLLDRLRVVRELQGIVQWFPADGYGFDLARLTGADVVRSSKEDAFAPTNHLAERLAAAERVQITSYTMFPDCLETCWRAVTDGSQELDLIVEEPVLAAICSHSTLASHLRDLLRSDSTRVYRSGSPLPHVVVVTDDVVNLCLFDEDGVPHATIDTTDEVVHAWARSRFESYRRDAVPVDETLLAP